jgi:Mg-chelatase subunit ChlD
MKSLLLAAAVMLLAASASAQSRGSSKTHTRQIFVHVAEPDGTAIGGLAAADFTVTEGGQARQVSHAGPADVPMRIALMLDTSAGTAPELNHMRSAAAAFLDALPPNDEVILITTGRQVRVRLPPTTDREQLKHTAAGLFNDGGTTVLMDGLLEIDERFFRKAEDRWPVYVIFTSDGTEGSAGGRENEFTRWALLLGQRGISAHALVLKTPKGRGLPESNGLPQIVAENLTQNTGGDYDVMNSTAILPDKMKAVAQTLARSHRNMHGWYALDIQSAETEEKPVVVTLAGRDGVTLRILDRRRGQ